MTPQEFLEAHVLSRPILIRDVSILRGSQSITGSFSRFLRVTGQPLLVVDQGRVRASWSTGRFSVRIPGDVTRAPRHAAPSNGIPETFVMSPACSVTVSLPRGADCMVGLVCGRAEVKVSYDSGTVTLDSSADGAVVVISWVEFGTREQDVALAEAAVSDHVGDLTALATSNLIDVIRTRQRLGS